MKTLITNAQVFDGTGAERFAADVLIDGERIARVGAGIARPAGDFTCIDADGATLMPGMIDGHTHLGLGSTVEYRSSRTEPEETQALIISHNARVMLDHGFTSCYSGGNRRAKVEVALRDAIAAGWMPGPRLRATSWEVSADTMKTVSADLKGGTAAHASAADRAPITEKLRRFVNDMADVGVDVVKVPITGESALIEHTSKVLEFQEQELAGIAEVARERGVWLTAHAHSEEGIQMAVRNGFRVIYHATYMDDETVAAVAAAKDRIFIAPSPGSLWMMNRMENPPTPGMEIDVATSSLKAVVPRLLAAGVKIVLGSDYGFGFNPIGRNAMDLQLFVEWFGMTSAQALRCATETGGYLMGMEDELGLVREGYLADLLLVNGDPTHDVTVLQDPKRLTMIMQNGRFHKLTAGTAVTEVIKHPEPAMCD